jgi:hypothetical protein
MAPDRKNPDKSSLASAASDQIRAIIEAAEQTAAQIRAEAEDEATRIRQNAEEEASGIRSDARGDVKTLLDSIRDGVSRLGADLEQLEEKLQPPKPAPAPTRSAPEPAPKSQREPESEPAPTLGTDADLESARLVALNMALDGASRDDVDQYLSENFSLSNRKALLDDVYASIGG